jgi:hypothetical protein
MNTDTVDRALGFTATVLGYLIMTLLVVLVLGALLPRHAGSWDNMDAETIKNVVEGAQR